MRSDEVQVLVDQLASRLRRSVAVDDQNIRLVAASRHFGDEDPLRVKAVLAREVDRDTARFLLESGISQAQEPILVDANPQRQLKPRWCCPLRWDDRLLGFLWLITDEYLTDEDRAEATRVAREISMVLYGRRLAEQRESAFHSSLVRELLSSNDAVARAAENDMVEEHLLRRGDHVVVAIVAPVDDVQEFQADQLHPFLSTAVRDLGSNHPECTLIHSAMGFRYVILLAGPSTSRAKLSGIAAQIAGSLVASAASFFGHPMLAGVGDITEAVKGYRSLQQAKVAARGAGVMPGHGPTVTWSDLGVFGQLLQLVDNAVELQIPTAARVLRAADTGGTLVATATAFLDAAGDTTLASERLFIHRTTLYYRLNKIAQLTGLDLSNGIDRLTLHLGLKLAEVAQLN